MKIQQLALHPRDPAATNKAKPGANAGMTELRESVGTCKRISTAIKKGTATESQLDVLIKALQACIADDRIGKEKAFSDFVYDDLAKGVTQNLVSYKPGSAHPALKDLKRGDSSPAYI